MDKTLRDQIEMITKRHRGQSMPGGNVSQEEAAFAQAILDLDTRLTKPEEDKRPKK
jgi:hypothetical protein